MNRVGRGRGTDCAVVSGVLIRGRVERWGMSRGCIVTHRIDPVPAVGQFKKIPAGRSVPFVPVSSRGGIDLGVWAFAYRNIRNIASNS